MFRLTYLPCLMSDQHEVTTSKFVQVFPNRTYYVTDDEPIIIIYQNIDLSLTTTHIFSLVNLEIIQGSVNLSTSILLAVH